MNHTKLLKPAPGVKVRCPCRKHLAEEGEQIEMNSFWHRRLATGDVVEVSVAKATTKVADDGRAKDKQG